MLTDEIEANTPQHLRATKYSPGFRFETILIQIVLTIEQQEGISVLLTRRSVKLNPLSFYSSYLLHKKM